MKEACTVSIKGNMGIKEKKMHWHLMAIERLLNSAASSWLYINHMFLANHGHVK
jgi:hypothetical protein